MSIIQLFALSLAALVAEQFVVARRLGLPAPLDGGYRAALTMGLTVTVELTVSMALCWVVYAFLLAPFGMEYLAAAFLLLTAGLTWLGHRLLLRAAPEKTGALRRSLPLAAVNCAVLGSGLTAPGLKVGLAVAVSRGAMAGVVFLAAALVFTGLWERLAFSRVPKAFEGLPIAMAAAGLTVFALLGFTGFYLW